MKLSYTVIRWGNSGQILQEVNANSFEKAKEIYKKLESPSVLESVEIRINEE